LVFLFILFKPHMLICPFFQLHSYCHYIIQHTFSSLPCRVKNWYDHIRTISKRMIHATFFIILSVVSIYYAEYECLPWTTKTLFDSRQYTHWIFVSICLGNSPIGESSVDIRQYMSWTVANWRRSIQLSPIHCMEFRQ
jgi:hypothetical protein